MKKITIFLKSMINIFKNLSLKKHKKKLIIILSSVLMLFFIGGTIAYFKRDALLKEVVDKVVFKAKNKYNLNVKIGSYGFSGLSTVYFNRITVVPVQRDSLANIKSLKVGVKLFPLIFGNVRISEFGISDGLISLVKKDSSINYEFLFKKDEQDSTKLSSTIDLSELANKLLKQVLDKIPEEMNVNQFMIRFDTDTTHLSLFTETATIHNEEVKSTIKVNGNEATWHLNGTANPSEQHLDLKFYADHQKVEFPYLDRKFNLKLSFDTVRSMLTGAKKVKDLFEIDGSWTVKNLLINHPKIAANDIIVKNGAIDAKILVGSNYVALDSSSVIYLGKAQMNPFIKYTLRPQKIYELQIHAFEQKSQDIFDAFPVGLFESFEGIKVQGNMHYALNLDRKSVV